MIVAVVSPQTETGAGNTVVSMMLSHGLAGMNKKVLLTHTDPQSEAFYTYYGLQEYEDKTTTPTQLVKLLKAGAIQPEEVTDYCKNVIDGVDIFTNNETNFNDEDMLVFTEFVRGIKEYDFVIYEIDNPTTKTAEYVLENAEIIVLNVTQDKVDLKKFKKKKEDIARMCKGKQTIMVCNKFSKSVGTDKSVTKFLGLKTRCYTFHYNNWVRNACNNGKIVELYHTVKSKGALVVELDRDIVNLSKAVSKAQTGIIKSKNKKATAGRGLKEVEQEDIVEEKEDNKVLQQLKDNVMNKAKQQLGEKVKEDQEKVKEDQEKVKEDQEKVGNKEETSTSEDVGGGVVDDK